jgi:hypothetical protein
MEKQNKNVNLLINGRLFPSWIMANFKQYKLAEIFKTSDDPCSKKIEKAFRKYQLFVSNFLDYHSSYKDILIYHGLGSGKTATAINVYNVLYNSNPGWNVFLLIKAGLHQTWLNELKDWLNSEEKEFRMKNIIFVHYDSPFANKSFLEAVRTSDSSKKNIYIVDECHNFIRNVYSNISTNKGKRAQEIYDYIIQDKIEKESSRVVLLSGTPAINTPYELALMFNLLRPNLFPKSESLFNQFFINQTSGEINPAYKNMFQRRILGLVSYYIGATPDFYAEQIMHYVNVTMSDYQRSIYKFFEEMESKSMQKSKGKSESYRTYTRQACNFVFPNISQYVTGEQRPRPSRFRISEREAEKIAEGRAGTKEASKAEQTTDIQGYLTAINNYVTEFDNYLDDIKAKDTKNKYTLQDDIKKFKEIYKNDYEEFFRKEKKKSGLFTALHSSSPKILNMIFNAIASPGTIMMYSNYVIMEGIQLMKIYLKYFGYTLYGDKKGENFHRYIEYSGNISKDVREENLSMFNKPENRYGENIRIFLLSPAAAEGLTLKNIRQVHILEPYWHEVRITQMIGRGIRQCSHADLPINERNVQVYRYKSISEGILTADQYVEEKAKNRDRLITSFLDTIKEAAVDCNLNYAHNILKQDIKCFQFDEPSLLGKQVGPAYKKDILDDINMNNGSNSLKSITVKIRVVKITAVKKLGDDKYSEKEKYWYYPESHIVYDYDLKYPVGQVEIDKNGNPIKLQKDVYVIDKMVPITMIK